MILYGNLLLGQTTAACVIFVKSGQMYAEIHIYEISLGMYDFFYIKMNV